MMKYFPVLPLLLTALGLQWCSMAEGAQVGRIEMKGPIGPATADYVQRAIQVAESRGHECLIIEMDTPGGLLESTKNIVQFFYSSTVPTVVYVGPAGATATSAGCFITMAADVAVMAPDTTIGAAHPVQMGGGGATEQDSESKITEKARNYASSLIESIAERKDRNVEWARSAVTESASVTSEQALELEVIEFIAADIPDLLQQIDGLEVMEKSLNTADASVEEIPMLTREKVFQALWRPEVMYILMMIAIYGIIGELSNPGTIVPGVVGVVALILTLYMASIVPMNIAGVLLILLAIVLFVAEVATPTYGFLAVGGIVSFFIGSLMLFDNSSPVYELPLTLIAPTALITGGFFLFIVGAGIRAQFLPSRTGVNALVGKSIPAVKDIDQNSGKVFVAGEYWNAVSDEPIQAGQMVTITAIDHLTLKVKPQTME